MNVEIAHVSADAEGTLTVTVTLPISALPVTDGKGDRRERTAEEAATPEEHMIIIPAAALDSRMRAYGLSTRAEALLAIVREHAKRLNALPDGDESADPRVRRMGGLRSDITVQRGNARISGDATSVVVGWIALGPD
jgi:hypothetical protein